MREQPGVGDEPENGVGEGGGDPDALDNWAIALLAVLLALMLFAVGAWLMWVMHGG